MKEKRNKIMKTRDDANKKLLLQKHTVEAQMATINRDKEKIKEEMKEKEKRCAEIDKELSQLHQKDANYLKDKELETRLRKSISFTYA